MPRHMAAVPQTMTSTAAVECSSFTELQDHHSPAQHGLAIQHIFNIVLMHR